MLILSIFMNQKGLHGTAADKSVAVLIQDFLLKSVILIRDEFYCYDVF